MLVPLVMAFPRVGLVAVNSEDWSGGVMVGVVAVDETVKVAGLDVALGWPLLTTVTETAPTVATWLALTAPVRLPEFTKVVASAVPPNTICEVVAKFDPVTVRVNPADPAATDDGDRLEMAGATTVIVTGTVTGLLEAEVEEMVTLPV